MATLKSCIDCYNCKVKNDRVRCIHGKWIANDGEEFVYNSLDTAKRISRRVLSGENYGYMSYANHCVNYSD